MTSQPHGPDRTADRGPPASRPPRPRAKPGSIVPPSSPSTTTRRCCGAIERDLRRRYAERYRVLRADSGASALDLVRQLNAYADTGAAIRAINVVALD